MRKNKYDFIVIGAGGTGLAAAMYAARLELSTLVLGATNGTELPIGGVITTTDLVENYPGFIKLSGEEIAKKIEEHARAYEQVRISEERAIDVHRARGKECFEVKTNKGNTYVGKTILFATGTKWRKLEVPGGIEFENKGVAYCALCDAPLFKGKVVGIIGGSDSAVKDALVISKYAKRVYIIYRGDKLRAEPVNMKRIGAKRNVELIGKTNVAQVKGNKFIESVVLDQKYRGKEELALEGLFVAIGHIPLSELAVKMGVKTEKNGEIVIDHKTSETNIGGVFAAGDVANKPFKQLITGVAEGCTAAYSAFQYITKNHIKPC